MGATLTAGGSSFDKVIKTTVLLADMEDFQKVNAVYGACVLGECACNGAARLYMSLTQNCVCCNRQVLSRKPACTGLLCCQDSTSECSSGN